MVYPCQESILRAAYILILKTNKQTDQPPLPSQIKRALESIHPKVCLSLLFLNFLFCLLLLPTLSWEEGKISSKMIDPVCSRTI